jgi:hypothetical protein
LVLYDLLNQNVKVLLGFLIELAVNSFPVLQVILFGSSEVSLPVAIFFNYMKESPVWNERE